MGLGVIGAQLDGLAEPGDRLGEAVLPGQEDAERLVGYPFSLLSSGRKQRKNVESSDSRSTPKSRTRNAFRNFGVLRESQLSDLFSLLSSGRKQRKDIKSSDSRSTPKSRTRNAFPNFGVLSESQLSDSFSHFSAGRKQRKSMESSDSRSTPKSRTRNLFGTKIAWQIMGVPLAPPA
jgi:hypothetical protein